MTPPPHRLEALARPTRRGLLLGGAGVILIVLGASTGFTDLVRAGIFALLLLLFAMVLVSVITLGTARAQVSRFGPDTAMCAGESTDLHVDADLPASVRISDAELVEPHTFVRDGRASTSAAARVTLRYTVTPEHRGAYTSGPTRLEAVDPLGLARSSRTLAKATEWIVWPAVRGLDTAPHLTPGQGEDSTPTTVPAQTGEPGASTRPYVRGDDTRLVHWPATAHRGELIIRQFDPPADDMVAVELVGDVPVTGTDDAWEALVVHTASLWRHLQADRRPAALTIADVTTHDASAGLDALARAASCPCPERRAADITTWAFVHTSADEVPLPPAHAEGHAVVAGEDSALTDALSARMADLGWIMHPVMPTPTHVAPARSRTQERAA